MTIGKQIGISIAGMVAICAAVGATGWWYVNRLGNHVDRSINRTSRKIELAGDLRSEVFTFRLQERGMLLFSYIKADAQVTACRDAYDKAMAATEKTIAEIRPLLETSRGRDFIDQAEAGIQEYRTLQLEVRRLLAAGEVEQATEWDRTRIVPAGGKVVAALDGFSGVQTSLNSDTKTEAEGIIGMARVVLLLGLLLCAVLGGVVGYAMHRATGKLHRTAVDLEQAAREVSGAASQVSASSNSLAQGSSEQAASLQETSASSAEISAMASKHTELSLSAADLVMQSQQKFVVTNQSLEETVAAMDEIHVQSSKIAHIIKVIDEIAFQTNILALNAAVEAARAGEAGMGFAVVADEVRNLAQRSAQAAKDTATLIEESIRKSDIGKSRVDDIAAAIKAVTGQASRVKVLVDELSQGSQEQARGIEQIARAITQMERVTQQTAASAEQGAAAAEELNSQSRSLKGIMGRLTDLVGRDQALRSA